MNRSYVQVPTLDIQVSSQYYQALGFEKKGDFYTDGKLTIKLTDESKQRQGLVLLFKDLDQFVLSFKEKYPFKKLKVAMSRLIQMDIKSTFMMKVQVFLLI